MSDYIETNDFNKFSLDLNLEERRSLGFFFLQRIIRHIGFLHLFSGSPTGLVKSEDLLTWGRIWTAGMPVPDNVPYHTFPGEEVLIIPFVPTLLAHPAHRPDISMCSKRSMKRGPKS